MDDWEDLEPKNVDTVNEQEEPPANASDEPVAAKASTPKVEDADEPLCRICFSGADEEDLGVYLHCSIILLQLKNTS